MSIGKSCQLDVSLDERHSVLIAFHGDCESSREKKILAVRASNFNRIQAKICISKLLRCNRERITMHVR